MVTKLILSILGVIVIGIVAVFIFLPDHKLKQPTHQLPEQVQPTQQVKQELAKVDTPIMLSFTPESQTVHQNSQVTVQLILDSNDLQVTGVDISLPLDTDTVEFVSFKDSRKLNSPLISAFDATNATFRFSAVDTSSNKITGKIVLGELTLKAKKSGVGKLNPTKSQLTASGYDKYIPTHVTPATITIE